jgi:deferrochelatase/peroxidase EfeB
LRRHSRDRGGAVSRRIQEGVFFRRGERPPPCWRLLLLDVADGAEPAEARAAIGAVLNMLAALRRGNVRELRGQPADGVDATKDTFRELAALIGYGRSLFDAAPPLARSPRPEFLAHLPSRGDAFPAIPWVEGERPSAEADLAFQLTGTTAAAVNRAAVEVWKLIEDEELPLAPVGSFDGFGRPDGRGWLEFHDGVSNMESSQRIRAIAAGPDPDWMAGGTYMAFLRLRVDMRVWRALDRGDQELVVGRDKLSGDPLVAVRRDARGRARPVAAPEERRDPPQTGDPLLESSHVHRANQNRASPDSPAALRMFRQGYDFLDAIGPDGPELGMNFVSFQSDLQTLQHVMHLPGWLADANFGGPAAPAPGDPPSPGLISLLAGGCYAVPPRSRPFPGAGLFA